METLESVVDVPIKSECQGEVEAGKLADQILNSS